MAPPRLRGRPEVFFDRYHFFFFFYKTARRLTPSLNDLEKQPRNSKLNLFDCVFSQTPQTLLLSFDTYGAKLKRSLNESGNTAACRLFVFLFFVPGRDQYVAHVIQPVGNASHLTGVWTPGARTSHPNHSKVPCRWRNLVETKRKETQAKIGAKQKIT